VQATTSEARTVQATTSEARAAITKAHTVQAAITEERPCRRPHLRIARAGDHM
jgi:hypothetical protein